MNYASVQCGALLGVAGLALALMPALALRSASAQPPASKPTDKATQPGQPGADRPGRGQGRGGPQSEWAEKYREQMKDHPRLARSLVNLHDTKDYLNKSATDLGGHKTSAVKAIDAAIVEIEAAMKAEPKQERPPPAEGDQPRRRGRPGGDVPPPPKGT